METNVNDFAAACAASEKAQAHNQEIQQTRVGGLGGSDAAILRRIGQSGLAGLTATDTKRLCVMVGKCTPEAFGGNAYTNAGHAFEEYCEQMLPWGAEAYEREKVMTNALARNFKTFAHADFVTGENDVIECKFVQDTTANTAAKYAAQLQWYFILGAKSVRLCHGMGTVDPFCVDECEIVEIARDEQIITEILAGVCTLDEALTDGWLPMTPDKVTIAETPAVVQRAFETLQRIKEQEQALAAEKEVAALEIREYIETFGLSGIVGEEHQVVYSRASVSTAFDSKKFLQDHPEFNLPEYQKQTKRAACVSFK